MMRETAQVQAQDLLLDRNPWLLLIALPMLVGITVAGAFVAAISSRRRHG